MLAQRLYQSSSGGSIIMRAQAPLKLPLIRLPAPVSLVRCQCAACFSPNSSTQISQRGASTAATNLDTLLPARQVCAQPLAPADVSGNSQMPPHWHAAPSIESASEMALLRRVDEFAANVPKVVGTPALGV